MTEQVIRVPDIGGAEGAEVVEILVAPGDAIALEQSLIVLESDKASMEIPASTAGVVTELRVALGDMIAEGDVILALAVEDAGATEAASARAPSAPDAGHAEPSESETALPREAEMAVTPASSASGAAQSASIPVAIPDLGSDEGADLVEILVPVGTIVAEGDSLVLLESDKAAMEVPAPAAGVILEWLVEPGITVKEGVIITTLAVAAPSTSAASTTDTAAAPINRDAEIAQPASTPPSASKTVASPAASGVSKPRPPENRDESNDEVYAGPAVRKLAREFGVNLNKVTGRGAKGRILKEDLQQYVARSLAQPASGAPGAGAGIPAIPDVDFGRFGSIERVARSRIDKLTATNMVRSWLNVPHVTQFDDADISEMERFRNELKPQAAERGVRLTPLPFILKACAVALRDNPKLKSSLADGGETLIMKQYCHIGMAVDTPGGLVVPVIRDVDKKSIWELAAEVASLAERARDKQLKPEDMQGGVFTVSSLGALGGRGFTPIINAPEVAILGVGRAAVQPVWDGEVFRPHTLLPLALSYDHRVVNGGDGGRFMTALTALLADVKRMVM